MSAPLKNNGGVDLTDPSVPLPVLIGVTQADKQNRINVKLSTTEYSNYGNYPSMNFWNI